MRTRFPRSVLAACALAVGLGGCLDSVQTVTFAPDGRTSLAFDARFDKEAEDIFALFPILAEVAPEAAMLRGGICPAASMLSVAVPEFKSYTIKGEEARQPNGYVCKLSVGGLPDIATLSAPGALAKFDPWGMYEFKQIGPKRYMIAVDYAKMPDLAALAKQAAAEAKKTSPPPPGAPSDAVMENIIAKSIKGAAALANIMMRGRKNDLVISAARIVESNGVIAPDGKSVRFTMTTEEAVGVMLKTPGVKLQRLFAVIEH